MPLYAGANPIVRIYIVYIWNICNGVILNSGWRRPDKKKKMAEGMSACVRDRRKTVLAEECGELADVIEIE